MERFAIKIDKKLRANLYKICRLCGMDNPDMVPILSDKEATEDDNVPFDVEAEMEMSQKINLLIGISVTKDDRMPQTMCGLCVDKINDFYEFREMCYATNSQTRKLLGLKAIKTPVADIKPKIEVKQEEQIVPTPISSKNGNRKRKADEVAVKEEATTSVFPKKKLRFSNSSIVETDVKEEVPGMIKKKLRFTAASEEIITTGSIFGNASKKTKNSTDDSKAKKEPTPPLVPAVSNKKLRIVAPAQKEAASKKSKQKGSKNDFDVKEEIKEEIQEETPVAPAPSSITTQDSLPIPRLKFGCNICSERFPSKGKMETHIRAVHLPKIERYVCTACNEILNKSFDIKNHQLWHKLSKTPYVCGCCGESILNTYAFTRHLREHAFETPPALLVLDRECPQCHTSYATNFLYNTHICAVRTRRCAGCNRLQRNEGEYLRHSAHCAKVYLNYSKHIMPSVEALEDSVRIKNENDVEAAAEEMARLSGVSLDMAPVVQLTRLSSPIIMAANHCVSIPCLDDSASTSSKKSGKKGVSKKDLKRVDELLKSTLDALVSIKHEPEVHVEQETPSSAENSDNDDNANADVEKDQEDDFHHNDADSDNGNENNTTVSEGERSLCEEAKEIKIKQEVEEGAEDNFNKIGFGLKLKIKKEHGQLNSSIIEQQKSTEKRGEKRKKKKKHKDKEKDKQKLSKDLQDEQLSQDSNANNNVEETTIRIKTEPQDGNTGEEVAAVVPLQVRPQPEATIMTSIPMMQFQIACVSSGVEFSNINNQQTASSVNHEVEQEDVKPNRAELDRMIKISNVSSGVIMAANETEMDQDGNDNVENCVEDRSGNDHEDYDDEDSDQHEHCEEEDEEGATENNEPNNEEVIASKSRKLKSKSTSKSKEKAGMVTIPPKSRNKACKSTAKPANLPVLQISAVEGGVALESSIANSAADESDFAPIYIKPEPQNRGYSDEQPANTLHIKEVSSLQTDVQPETLQTHSIEEQSYISSIDFHNVVIKQEKDIEINDVQITKKSSKSYAGFNGVRRKRKQICRSHVDKNRSANEEREKNDVENYTENMEEDDGFEETDGEAEEEEDDQEDTDEVEEEEDEEGLEEEEEEEDEEDQEDEVEEEREYRELEYPPQIAEKISEAEEKESHEETEKRDDAENMKTEREVPKLNSSPEDTLSISTQIITSAGETPAFIISSVCSHALTDTDKAKEVKLDPNSSKLVDSNSDQSKDLVCINSGTLMSNTASVIDTNLNNVENTQKFCLITKGEDISGSNRNTIANIDTANHLQRESLNIVTPTTHPTLPPHELDGNVNSDEITLRLGQSFEIKPADHGLGFTQVSKGLDSAQSSSQVCLKSDQYKSFVSDSLTISTTQILSKHDTQSSHSQNSKNLENNILLTQQTSQFSQENSQNNDQLILTSQDTHRHYYRDDGQLAQSEENMALSLDKNVYFPSQKSYSNNNVTVQLNDGSEMQHTQQINQTCVGSLSYLVQGCEITDKNRLYSQQNAEGASDHVLNSQHLLTQNDETTFPTLVAVNSHIASEVNHETQNVQHVSEYLQDPVFKISSVSSAVLEDFSHLESNNDDKEIIKDNQESGVISVEGAVHVDKHVNLYAQPVTGTAQKETCQTDVENDGRENESNIEEDDNAEDQHLEERQNYENQEVLSQIRPAALALHPYLEDISSSSNSLLSNSLSQTPPPPTPNQPTTSNASAVAIETFNTREQLQSQQDLNTEVTENILNETNDILSRRSTANAAATSVSTTERQMLLPHPHLAQQLPTHVPTFNFDNINEIAENNNNANIEREQLQDEQQQQVSNNVT